MTEFKHDTPRWQLWLLARLPRPVAIGLMIAGYLAAVSLVCGLSLVGSFLLAVLGQRLGAPDTLIALVALVGSGAWLRGLYGYFNQALPTREKKKGDADDGE